ncbi:ABC transporter ATP-binding protein [Microbacterium lacticum]|uniref:ATP-binding cassette domain-containing protein n=1 Tax=Microbacterium lacticum TaxID=33885 RepID=UPI0018B0BDC7|nr:ABC transporter ATP-binding protein [Microbacterium lacticum]MBF9335017.1 ABC transporter ATP-binding protein [Microbacterium lacticum]
MTTQTLLPTAARRRVILISLGWILVALAEATAYTILALAIAQQQAPTMVLVTATVALIITVLVSRGGYLTGVRLAGDLFHGIGTAFSRAKLSWFTEKNRALVRTVAGQSIPALMSVPAHQLQTFILSPLIPLLLLIGIAIVSGPFTMLLVAGLLVISFLAQLAAQRALSRSDAGRSAAEQAATEASLEFIDHLELLRTAAGPDRAVERLVESWKAQETALARTNCVSTPATLISTLASVLPLAGVMILIAATSAAADPATALALIILTARAAAPLDALALAGVAINDLRATLDHYRAVANAPVLPEPPVSAEGTGYEISMHSVSHISVLDGISAQIPEGSTTIVTGPTGSGKSTLLSLLMRFDDPDTGHITLGGVNLADMSHGDLAKQIGYVPQDPIVFDGTLADNIRLGNPAATDEDIINAAQQAVLGTVIERSPLGIRQQVGHHGSALSGGERQRIAIARALLKKAPILILDEATSALDSTTENTVAETIRALECTKIIVTHRNPEETWQPTHRIEVGATRGAGD